MAKGPTITTIASGYYSRTALNDNFTNIDAAFDNTLSLDGSTPNSMQGDLDLNGNQVINGVGKFNTLYLDNDLVGNLSTAFTFLGAWVTGTSYSAYDVVTDSGNTYVALEAHTAGSTFSTDLSAAKWSILAAKGASGAGSGDMLVANNLSDVANAATSRSNLGLGASDSPTFTNITPTGTVDGRDLAVDGAKLDLLDQGLATTDSPTFNVVTATSYVGIVNSHVSTKVTAPAQNATVSATHGLGVIPDHVTFRITCTTADAGFSIGDIMYYSGSFIERQAGFGFNVTATTTTTSVRRSNYAWQCASGTSFGGITNTSWDIEIISEAF